MIFEIEEDGSWWVNSCATKHVCNDMSFYKTFKTMEDGCIIFMGNYSTTIVKRKMNSTLEFTSGKVLTSNDVYYVQESMKNLRSESLLDKFGFNLVFESN
jgi:hypothetical protein